MQDFLEKIKKEWRETLKNFGIKPKDKPTMMTEQNSSYEINLVPEVKRQMIKAMKFRNIMLFVCIILVAAAGGTVAIMASIWEGQNIAMSNQDTRLKSMSDKLNSYESLGELLTIQSQLKNIEEINSNKKVLSRIFSVVGAMLPTGPDTISISEMTVDMSANSIRFDAQADAKVSPYIDYRVLESFKKGVGLMKYDYGRYVDEEGNDIPTRCMIETDAAGSILSEEEKIGNVTNKYVYAYWTKGRAGCDPQVDNLGEDQGEVVVDNSASNSVANMLEEFAVTGSSTAQSTVTQSAEELAQIAEASYNQKIEGLDDYGKALMEQQVAEGISKADAEVIKVYRSPRFSEWYKEGYIDEAGQIEGVPHFNSECIVYSGAEVSGSMRWTSDNDCNLATEDVTITDSSNGRDSDGNLVLRFTAIVSMDEAVLKFTNKHVMAISPSGQNVTDSYVQIQGMFAERAEDCSDSDVICTTTATDISTEGNV